MREIKFSAIYKPTGETFVPSRIEPITRFVHGTFDNLRGNWCHFSTDGFYGDAIIRHHTGINDVKGTEILDGDILDAQSDSVQIVCWDENQARYKSVPLYAYKTNAGNGGWSGYDLFNRKLEVIGNIHQHPELLNN